MRYELDDVRDAIFSTRDQLEQEAAWLERAWTAMRDRVQELEGYDLGDKAPLVVWALRVAHGEWVGTDQGEQARRALELADLLMVTYNLVPDDIPWMW